MKEYIVRYKTEQIENSEFFYGGKVECELIRCRDCKHRMHNKTCIKVMKRKPDDGFCDEGERKQY